MFHVTEKGEFLPEGHSTPSLTTSVADSQMSRAASYTLAFLGHTVKEPGLYIHVHSSEFGFHKHLFNAYHVLNVFPCII